MNKICTTCKVKDAAKGTNWCTKKCKKEWDKTQEVTKKCRYCKESYRTPKLRAKKNLYCSKKCRNKVKNEQWPTIYNPIEWVKHKRKLANEMHSKENEFSKNKYKYNDRIIKYKDSPTGSAYIGLAKGALMKNDNGIGFKGVKLQSENRELVQCYECGEWFAHLSGHIFRKHKTKPTEYKKKFGFNPNEGLVSDVVSNKLAVTIVANNIRDTLKRSGAPKIRYKKDGNKGNTCSMQYKNRKETCPLQLKEALVNYIKRFRRIPKGKSGRDVFSKYMTIERRFNGFNNALKAYGLPTRHRVGTRTEYVFPKGDVLYTKTGDSLEPVFEKMMKECKILTEKI